MSHKDLALWKNNWFSYEGKCFKNQIRWWHKSTYMYQHHFSMLTIACHSTRFIYFMVNKTSLLPPWSFVAPRGRHFSWLHPQNTHRVATAIFWRTFHHDGKNSQGWSHIHERTVNATSLTFLGINLRFSDLWFIIKCFLHYKPVLTHFCSSGGGGE